jgi:hypothetical protein
MLSNSFGMGRLRVVGAAEVAAGRRIAVSASTPASAGLVSHFTFDAALNDAGPAGNHGSFVGAEAPPFVQGFDCAAPGALRFDGVDDYVGVARNADLPLSQRSVFSIALWVRGLPQPDRRVFSEGSTTNNNTLFNLGTDNTGMTGALDFFLRNGAGTAIAPHVKSASTVFDGDWHHVAWTDDNGAVVLYVDGAPDATNFSYARAVLAFDTTTLGGILRAAPCCFFAGDIDDVRLYNYPLSQAEVLEH